MNLAKYLIVINDEPKTLQIDSIKDNGSYGYSICFKNSTKTYNYGYNKVHWLGNPKWIDPTYNQVFTKGMLQKQIKEIWKFESDTHTYWRIVFSNDFIKEYIDENIAITSSCLNEKETKDTFSYLRNVSFINPLGKDENSNGILRELYDRIDFIGEDTAAACYLNPHKYTSKILQKVDLIYPFGCNSSQKEAVSNAFEHQISVIQGPPGTGKTQTILNIISNIVLQGKTVMVVSNNNSATANVLEKLEKYGLSFIVASLGNKENKDKFISNQPSIPPSCLTWKLDETEIYETEQKLKSILQKLDQVYTLQNERANLLQEEHAINLEWKHFCLDNKIEDGLELNKQSKSKSIVSIWLKCQTIIENEETSNSSITNRFLLQLKWLWIKWFCKHRLHIECEISKENLTNLIKELQILYYLNRQQELHNRIELIENELIEYNAKNLTDRMIALSMSLLKDSLYKRYKKNQRKQYIDVMDMKRQGKVFAEQYPVVLSTTFSSRSCVFTDEPYDYLIMDEASQVSIDTGALALTCAKKCSCCR